MESLFRANLYRAAVAVAGWLAWSCAAAEPNPDAVLGRQLEKDMESAYLASQGKWVELPTGSWAARQFVAVLEHPRAADTVLVHFRIDHPVVEEGGVASVTQTIRLACDKGTKRVLASYGYNLEGKQLFAKQMPKAASTPIENLYAGPYQMICSGTYLLTLVPDGFRRYGEALAERRKLRAESVAERPIPVPAAP